MRTKKLELRVESPTVGLGGEFERDVEKYRRAVAMWPVGTHQLVNVTRDAGLGIVTIILRECGR